MEPKQKHQGLGRSSHDRMTLGTDLELVVMGSRGPVSAIPLIEGTKERPLETAHGHIQHDNVLAEVNSQPASSERDFVNKVLRVQEDLDLHLKYHSRYYHAVGISVAAFSTDDLMHPDAMQFACAPDLDAWSEMPGSSVEPSDLGYYRTVGGHLHLRFYTPEWNEKALFALVRSADLQIGLRSVARIEHPYAAEKHCLRRNFYGQAGRCRIKPDLFHVEYRTPTPEWAVHPDRIRMMYRWACYLRDNPFFADDLLQGDREIIADVQNVINTRAKTSAAHLLSFLGMHP